MALGPEPLDAAIIFAPAGELVPAALRATAPGGVVVCAGIHMSDIPSFPYSILWEERVLRSVANLTRADAHEFLELAPQVPIRTTVQEFALEDAEEALDRLRAGQHRRRGGAQSSAAVSWFVVGGAAGELVRAAAGGEVQRIGRLHVRAERVRQAGRERVAGPVRVAPRAGQVGGLPVVVLVVLADPLAALLAGGRDDEVGRRVELVLGLLLPGSLAERTSASSLTSASRSVPNARGVATSRRARRACSSAPTSPPLK